MKWQQAARTVLGQIETWRKLDAGWLEEAGRFVAMGDGVGAFGSCQTHLRGGATFQVGPIMRKSPTSPHSHESGNPPKPLTIMDSHFRGSEEKQSSGSLSDRLFLSPPLLPATGRLRSPSLIGWNKFWAGNVLYGWFGEVVTMQPLRLAALEISAGEALTESVRSYLLSRWETPEATPDPPSDVERILNELGVRQEPKRLSSGGLRLIQRLSLDRREQPFIERWRWTAQSGVAYLSDEGRVQVKPSLPWGRAIEDALAGDGVLPDGLAAALGNANPDTDELPLPTEERGRLTPAAEALVARLEFFGLARRWAGGVKLGMPIGSSPGILAALMR